MSSLTNSKIISKSSSLNHSCFFDGRLNLVGYGIVRLAEKFDDSDTVKFVFIKWVGENIHRMLRARLGTHSGAIRGIFFFLFYLFIINIPADVFSPYHVDVEATTKDEVTEDIILAVVRKASGKAIHVIDKPSGGSSSASVCYYQYILFLPSFFYFLVPSLSFYSIQFPFFFMSLLSNLTMITRHPMRPGPQQ